MHEEEPDVRGWALLLRSHQEVCRVRHSPGVVEAFTVTMATHSQKSMEDRYAIRLDFYLLFQILFSPAGKERNKA